jgi:hypothetical protein
MAYFKIELKNGALYIPASAAALELLSQAIQTVPVFHKTDAKYYEYRRPTDAIQLVGELPVTLDAEVDPL